MDLTNPPLRSSVIVSAYGNAPALDHVLRGWRVQTLAPMELIVTEDSATHAIAQVVQRHQAQAPFPIVHLTQEDNGFRKCLALNRAIAAAQGDWLVFTDGDVLPRADVLAQFARLARPGRFVSAGSHLNLPQAFHKESLTPALVESQQVFARGFLALAGITLPASRLLPAGGLARMLDTLTPRNAFVGNLSGAWRADVLRVAGFDEAMGYGGEDRNLGLRLNHAGVRGLRARHSLVCLHLDHPRAWAHADKAQANLAHNRQLRGTDTTLPRRSVLINTRHEEEGTSA
jgi:glycosyltransferase involved in cell wall biosynthesis